MKRFYPILLSVLIWPVVQSAPLFVSARLIVFPFDPNTAYTIYARVGAITNITFSGDERVKGLYLSDSVQWITTVTPDKQDVFIKPTQPGLTNAGTLITTRYKYQLLFSSVNAQHVWYQRVSWYHHDADLPSAIGIVNLSSSDQKFVAKLNQSVVLPVMHHSVSSAPIHTDQDEDRVRIAQLNFRYHISGRADFRPELVFDNGQKTWFRLPEGVQHVPAIFSINGRDLTVVNYAIHGNLYVLPSVEKEWLLKIGSDEVHVIRIKQCSLFDFRCHHNIPQRI